jgi:putative transcriptional regulator
MNDKRFNEQLASVREGGRILRGKAPASRVLKVYASDVKRIRAAYDLPQEEFAAMMGISVGTLRNWEQSRRDPEGSARVLLMVAEKHPEALLDVVQAAQRSR